MPILHIKHDYTCSDDYAQPFWLKWRPDSTGNATRAELATLTMCSACFTTPTLDYNELGAGTVKLQLLNNFQTASFWGLGSQGLNSCMCICAHMHM